VVTFVFLSEEHYKTLIWPAFSTDVKTGAHTVREEEHRLRVFKHVVLSKMFWSEEEEMTGGFRGGFAMKLRMLNF